VLGVKELDYQVLLPLFCPLFILLSHTQALKERDPRLVFVFSSQETIRQLGARLAAAERVAERAMEKESEAAAARDEALAAEAVARAEAELFAAERDKARMREKMGVVG